MTQKLLGVVGFVVILIVATIAGQIGGEIGKSAFSPSKLTQQQVNEKLMEGFTEAARQANAQGPVMVDDDTRWDRSAAGPGPRLTYFYSFPRYSSAEIGRNWLLSNLEPQVRRSVCTNDKMKASLEYGGIYVYAYSGNDGVEIARFDIGKADCGY